MDEQTNAVEIAPGVTISPGVRGGDPCLKGTRLPTCVPTGYASAVEFIEDYGGAYTEQQYEHALAFEASYLGRRLRLLADLEEAWSDMSDAIARVEITHWSAPQIGGSGSSETMPDEPRIYRVDECGEATWVVATSPEEALALAGPCDDPGVVSEETDLDGRGVTLDDGTTRTLREELAADPTPRIVCGTWT